MTATDISPLHTFITKTCACWRQREKYPITERKDSGFKRVKKNKCCAKYSIQFKYSIHLIIHFFRKLYWLLLHWIINIPNEICAKARSILYIIQVKKSFKTRFNPLYSTPFCAKSTYMHLWCIKMSHLTMSFKIKIFPLRILP